ncbi:MAG TPA: betaine/proline/choline family ABC transporter ATP-binding protein [Alphaproteobacteria bacterium]|nr:betaine/proline/choline family ABC transporter ATP-binding protein [Alphaproteobacteria bacterium]
MIVDSPPSETAVSCRSLWKIFGGRAQEALAAIRTEGLGKDETRERFDCVIGVADASFDVARGEIFCIMGLSGSGKSTLVRHINRLIEPTAGAVLIDGQDVNALSEPELRRVRAERIGMVFQNMALLPHRNVLDNVALGLELRGIDREQRYARALETLKLVQLDGWEGRMSHELSGGMQQRVGLARALAADPAVLLMDEPFSALDPLIRRQLQDQFIELSEVMKKTTIFITHDLDEAIRLGHRIAIMRDGVIVQIGTAEDIVTRPADDYVQDFVQGISRLKLVHAHHVMRPVDGPGGLNGHDPAECPQARPDFDLNALIDLAVGAEKPIVVMDDGRPVGVVTNRSLLRGIQGAEDDGN